MKSMLTLAKNNSLTYVSLTKCKISFIENAARKEVRYEVFCWWKESDESHVFCLERQKNGNLLWIDPQSGRKGGAKDFEYFIKRMRTTKLA